jgi:hypothetical protein
MRTRTPLAIFAFGTGMLLAHAPPVQPQRVGPAEIYLEAPPVELGSARVRVLCAPLQLFRSSDSRTPIGWRAWEAGKQRRPAFQGLRLSRFSDSSALIGGQTDAVNAQAAAPHALPGPLVGPPTPSHIVYRPFFGTA